MLTIEHWPIERFRLYERNPRKNDKAVDQMRASLREFGFAVPVLARSTGDVCDGHLRLKAAAVEKQWPSGDVAAIPVVLCDGWTEAQMKAFRLMANRSVTWADWDMEALAMEFGELKTMDFDLSLTGFASIEIEPFGYEITRPPASVEENIEEMRRIRRKGKKAVISASDTERYLVVVFPSREAKEERLAALGLPSGERYVSANALHIDDQFREDANVEWIAYGWRRSDSMSRALIMKRCGGCDFDARRVFPLRSWRRGQVYAYLDAHGIPRPPTLGRKEQGGLDFHPEALAALSESDRRRWLADFPFSGVQGLGNP